MAAVHFEKEGFSILLEKLTEQELTCTAGPNLSRFGSPAAGFELRIGSMAAPRSGAMDGHAGNRRPRARHRDRGARTWEDPSLATAELENDFSCGIHVAVEAPPTAMPPPTAMHGEWRKTSHDGVPSRDGSWYVSGT